MDADIIIKLTSDEIRKCYRCNEILFFEDLVKRNPKVTKKDLFWEWRDTYNAFYCNKCYRKHVYRRNRFMRLGKYLLGGSLITNILSILFLLFYNYYYAPEYYQIFLEDLWMYLRILLFVVLPFFIVLFLLKVIYIRFIKRYDENEPYVHYY